MEFGDKSIESVAERDVKSYAFTSHQKSNEGEGFVRVSERERKEDKNELVGVQDMGKKRLQL